MSLESRFNDLPKGVESQDITELRKALLRTQKQLSDVKKKRDDFTFAVVQAAHDAMLSAGPIQPVTPPKKAYKDKVAEASPHRTIDFSNG